MPRARSLIPPSQSAVHEPHSDHSSMTQSTGHRSSLHVCMALPAGHAAPMEPGVKDRVKFCFPPPQSTLHGSACHSPTSQSVTVDGSESIFNNSPRIFLSAHFSEAKFSMLTRHAVMVSICSL